MPRGYWEEEGAIRSSTGAVLRKVENTNLMILRSALQQVLIAAMEDVPIVLGARCMGVTMKGPRPLLRL
ncbi:MAG TPA: hypothetical protein VN648_10090, partial [Candidatus Methylomirabilis sp.]|nr:hypothetical protein [Candidatus Methylomirabilis sp.]